MRKILLLTIVIAGFYLQTYSQIDSRPLNNRYQIGTAFSGLALNNNIKTPSLLGSRDSCCLYTNSIDDRKYLYPKLLVKKVKIGQDYYATNKTTITFDKMPCVKPQGYSPMPVYTPDSTVKYTLLIKK